MINISLRNVRIYILMGMALLACYSPVYFSNYAFSDDWYYLFASATDPYSVLKWDVLSGRPVYGSLRYIFSGIVHSVDSLKTLRFLSVLSLIVLCCYIYNFISQREILKSSLHRAVFSILICMLPSFQVFNAWSVCFPYVTSILLAAMSYSALIKSKGLAGMAWSAILISIAFAIYQPTAMCFTFFAFLDNCLTKRKTNKRELIRIFSITFIGMLAALLLAKLFPLMLYGETLSRSNITLNPFDKIKWFVLEPLKNAICNFDTSRKALYVIISLLIISLGLKKIGGNGKTKIFLCIIFVFAAAIPNLIVKESWAAYRTITAFSLIITSCFLIGIFSIIDKVKFSRCIYLLLPVAVGLLTASNIKSGFSAPQQKEYALLKSAIINGVPKDFNGSLYYRLTGEHLPNVAKSTKYDEFGSLSLGMPWAFAGMALTVKNESGINYILPASPVITDNNNCGSNCIIIDAKDVLAMK